MMRELTEAVGGAVLESVGRASARVQKRRPLPSDLLESDDAYLVVFDAPGATASDVSVRFEDRTVRVRVDRFREFHEGFEMRFPGRGLSLDGSVTLPEGASVDPAAATATLLDNGTLEVELPKTGDGDGEIAVEDASASVEGADTASEEGADAASDEGEGNEDDDFDLDDSE